MAVFPLFVNLKDRKCIIVGGGSVAERKIDTLLKFDADITVVSPAATARIKQLALQGSIDLIFEEYNKKHIRDALIVIAATSDREVNNKIYKDAVQSNIFVNVVDSPEECTFIFPSVVKRGEMVVGISTSGSFPIVSKTVKRKIEELFPDNFGEIVELLKQSRDRVLKSIQDEDLRRELLNNIMNSIMSLDKKASTKEIRKVINTIIEEFDNEQSN